MKIFHSCLESLQDSSFMYLRSFKLKNVSLRRDLSLYQVMISGRTDEIADFTCRQNPLKSLLAICFLIHISKRFHLQKSEIEKLNKDLIIITNILSPTSIRNFTDAALYQIDKNTKWVGYFISLRFLPERHTNIIKKTLNSLP